MKRSDDIVMAMILMFFRFQIEFHVIWFGHGNTLAERMHIGKVSEGSLRHTATHVLWETLGNLSYH